MKFALPEFIKNLDIFGAPIPAFNLRGRDKVKTSCGAIISIIIMTITGLFAILKFEHMLIKKNPNITSNTGPIDKTERFSLVQDHFMMAFSVLHFNKNPTKQLPKTDP